VLQSDDFLNGENQKKKVILGACTLFDEIAALAKELRDSAPLALS
jgi:hypothetical protein